ncbi:CDP-diacylglycerol--serine O-phosphatidyltransferase [Alkalihalophilus sp. As8PL]|jgi:CDP-diacylglycerol---serine O-phosphatidyltransferase|uniref:CDP-diacylglycerol--serine O-phosphatidyltransferase n=2 Tax=Alkalihalophilus TaxID=2893060 RepID=A0AB39BW02_9BACI|nr:CDP-diacylglycerol--serine O-phosphatidyltransferase [Alkalihalophilus lindianensis]MDV2683034.1 CDP-diacylglycerol--serine O-phosphatidyltransferase [Alkalihalophilus lindianensis]
MFLLEHLDQTIKKAKGQIANILTLMNLGLGALSIIFVLQNELRMGLLFITIAAVCDRLDGAAARRFQCTSEFGKQLDSLSDIVSFGVAPALLIHQAILHEFGSVGAIFAIIFIICGAIRLARFNVMESHGFFVGLPITAAGCILTFSSLLVPMLEAYSFMFITVILALMMVSSFKVRKM